MTATQHAFIFGGACVFAAFVIAALCVVAWLRDLADDFDDDLTAQRDPGMGRVEPSDEPIPDALVAEVARSSARYIDTEWWLYEQGERS